MTAAPEHKLEIVLGEGPFVTDDDKRPDGRWLGRTPDGRVTLVKRRDGAETIAFQPIDFATAVGLAHRVIAGDARTITDPLTLAALAVVVAELGLHAPPAEPAASQKEG